MTKENDKTQISIGGFINGSRSLMPNTIEEAYRIATAFSRSDFIPKEYRDKPDNCFTAINLGMEIGLPPMRALQSIAVVNGKPTLYGDAQLALVRGSGLIEVFEESYEGEEWKDDFAALCKIKRKGDSEATTEKFTVADAKKAGLWNKAGPWSTHPKRMMRYKARAFGLRDKFADVLLGLTHSVEEMQGEIIDVTPKGGSKTANAHTPPAALQQSFAPKPDLPFETEEPELPLPPVAPREPQQTDIEDFIEEETEEQKAINAEADRVSNEIEAALKNAFNLNGLTAAMNYVNVKNGLKWLESNKPSYFAEIKVLEQKRREELKQKAGE